MVFQAETFEEMAEMSKQHGTEMYHKADAEHLKAMGAMKELMKTPGSMQQWFMDKKKEFDLLPQD